MSFQLKLSRNGDNGPDYQIIKSCRVSDARTWGTVRAMGRLFYNIVFLPGNQPEWGASQVCHGAGEGEGDSTEK